VADDLELQVALEEYRSLWAYYQRTLDERATLFNYYFKVVTVPAGLALALTLRLTLKEGGIQGIEFATASGSNDLTDFVSNLLSVIFLIGLAAYTAYSKETANGRKYEQSLNVLRGYFGGRFASLSEVLVIGDLRKPKSLFGGLGSIAFWRGMILVFMNSAIVTFAYFLSPDVPTGATPKMIFVVAIILQVLWGKWMSAAYGKVQKNKGGSGL